jgi:hypothetical protein
MGNKMEKNRLNLLYILCALSFGLLVKKRHAVVGLESQGNRKSFRPGKATA